MKGQSLNITLFEKSGKVFIGSATIIDQNTLLSAAHVVWPISNGFIERIEIAGPASAGQVISIEEGFELNSFASNPDPDGDGLATVSGISVDLALISLPNAIFLDAETSINAAASPGLVYREGFTRDDSVDTLTVDVGWVTPVEGRAHFTSFENASGHSGSGVYEISEGQKSLIGVVSSTRFVTLFDEEVLNWIDSEARQDDSRVTQAETNIDFVSDKRFYLTKQAVAQAGTDSNDFFELEGSIHDLVDGGDGFDYLNVTEGARLKLSDDGSLVVEDENGRAVECRNIELISNQSGFYFTPADQAYADGYFGLSVLFGEGVALDWGQVFRGSLGFQLVERSAVVTELMSYTSENDSEQMYELALEHLALGLSEEEDGSIREWASLVGAAEFVNGAIDYLHLNPNELKPFYFFE